MRIENPKFSHNPGYYNPYAEIVFCMDYFIDIKIWFDIYENEPDNAENDLKYCHHIKIDAISKRVMNEEFIINYFDKYGFVDFETFDSYNDFKKHVV